MVAQQPYLLADQVQAEAALAAKPPVLPEVHHLPKN